MEKQENTREAMYAQALQAIKAQALEHERLAGYEIDPNSPNSEILALARDALAGAEAAVSVAEMLRCLDELENTITGWEMDEDEETGETTPGMIWVRELLARARVETQEPDQGMRYVCSSCGKPISAAEGDDNGGLCGSCSTVRAAAPLMLKALKMIDGCFMMAQKSTPANLRRAIIYAGHTATKMAEGAELSEDDRLTLKDLGEEEPDQGMEYKCARCETPVTAAKADDNGGLCDPCAAFEGGPHAAT